MQYGKDQYSIPHSRIVFGETWLMCVELKRKKARKSYFLQSFNELVLGIEHRRDEN